MTLGSLLGLLSPSKSMTGLGERVILPSLPSLWCFLCFFFGSGMSLGSLAALLRLSLLSVLGWPPLMISTLPSCSDLCFFLLRSLASLFLRLRSPFTDPPSALDALEEPAMDFLSSGSATSNLTIFSVQLKLRRTREVAGQSVSRGEARFLESGPIMGPCRSSGGGI